MTKTAALKQFESWHKANPKAPLTTWQKRYNLALAGKPQRTKDAQDGSGVLPVSNDSLVGEYVEKINQTQNTEGQKTEVRRLAKAKGQDGTLASPCTWHQVELLFDECDIEMIAPLGGKNSVKPVKAGQLRPDLAARVQLAKASFLHTSDAFTLECSLAEVTGEAIYGLKQHEMSVGQWRECRKLVRDSVAMVCASHRLTCKTCAHADEIDEGEFISALREFALK
jgi:hypothetical protein